MRSPIRYPVFVLAYLVAALLGSPASAQSAKLSGSVTDETGGALPGVLVQLLEGDNRPAEATTDAGGHYAFDKVAPGPRDLVFGLINFAPVRRQVQVPQSGELRVEVALHLSLSADVTVAGKRTFTNLADAADPAQNLLGIAQSASQGAITGRQLDARPLAGIADTHSHPALPRTARVTFVLGF